jgi:hypothetical protein
MKKLIIALVIVLVLAVTFGTYQVLKQKNQIQELTLSNQNFKSIITARGEILVLQEQQLTTLKNLNAQDAQLIKDLKKKGVKDVSTIVQLTTENKRLKLELSYKPNTIIDTLVIKEGADLKTYLRVPLPFEHLGDPWLYAQGVVKTTGVTLDSLIVHSQPSIVLGWETKFFKKSAPIVVYQDQNPYTVVTDMSNIVIQQKPKFWKTPWWHRVEGAVLMFGTVVGVNALVK